MSLDFDNLITEGCIAGNENAGTGGVDPVTCKPTTDDPNDTDPPPSTDDRCADPSFRAANPDLCAGFPLLILKPAYARTQPAGTIQYATFLRTAGDEVQLTNGLDYRMADPGVASIENEDGLATGIATGITTVSVAWQNLHAFAQIEVIESCADSHSTFLVLIDNSKSSTVAFSGLYSTKLAYAKEAATKFAETVNYSKDTVGVAYFNDSGLVILEPSADFNEIKDAITSITQSNGKTNIAGGLQTAMDELALATGVRTIIMFSDGENNSGDDPVALANGWKSSNNVIIVVAMRSWGVYFDQLYKIASDGFFLSAYSATDGDVIQTLQGLRSYLCSGDCEPTPGTYPHAALGYGNLINWDVTRGKIDLIGLGLWDLQPGHGLYLDMNYADLKSKTTFSFVSGKTYRFQIKVAGNNRFDEPTTIRVQIGTLLDENISPSSWNQDFTNYSFDFTAGATSDEYITIKSILAAHTSDGCLIDEVALSNVTDDEVMLYDDLDSENPITIPVGQGYNYSCLTAPPGAQQADPTPPTPPLAE